MELNKRLYNGGCTNVSTSLLEMIVIIVIAIVIIFFCSNKSIQLSPCTWARYIDIDMYASIDTRYLDILPYSPGQRPSAVRLVHRKMAPNLDAHRLWPDPFQANERKQTASTNKE